MTYQIIVYYIAAFLVSAVSNFSYLLAGRFFGIEVREVVLGAPRVFRRGKWRIGIFPISSSVQFADANSDEFQPVTGATFDEQPRWVRAAVHVTGILGCLMLAFVLRGQDAWQSFINGWSQWIAGTLQPATMGAELLTGYARFVELEGPVAAAGVIAAKAAALNLLPLPMFAGVRALVELLVPPGGRARFEKPLSWLSGIGFVLLLAFVAAWAWALVVAVGTES
jgi:membrane-associated protease RseP (regulator of RpoE activity)